MPDGLETIRSQIQGVLLRSMSSLLETASSHRLTAHRALGPGSLGPMDPSAFDQLIVETAQRHCVDPSLVKAIVKVESNFDPGAVSHAGAKGLMQLMDGTAQTLGVTDAFDPAQNVEGGVRFIKYLLDRYNNDEALALAAYNAGPGAVDKHQGIPPFQETQKYVTLVLQAREAFCDHLV